MQLNYLFYFYYCHCTFKLTLIKVIYLIIKTLKAKKTSIFNGYNQIENSLESKKNGPSKQYF